MLYMTFQVFETLKTIFRERIILNLLHLLHFFFLCFSYFFLFHECPSDITYKTDKKGRVAAAKN